jgi:hypothetical protein
MAALVAATPELTVSTARLPRWSDAAALDRFRQGLGAAGLPG